MPVRLSGTLLTKGCLSAMTERRSAAAHGPRVVHSLVLIRGTKKPREQGRGDISHKSWRTAEWGAVLYNSLFAVLSDCMRVHAAQLCLINFILHSWGDLGVFCMPTWHPHSSGVLQYIHGSGKGGEERWSNRRQGIICLKKFAAAKKFVSPKACACVCPAHHKGWCRRVL